MKPNVGGNTAKVGENKEHTFAELHSQKKKVGKRSIRNDQNKRENDKPRSKMTTNNKASTNKTGNCEVGE